MAKFMLLHYGFEPPSPEVMEQWNAWFESVAEISVEHGGFHGGRVEISKDGVRPLEMDGEAITGYSVIEAENLESAQDIAARNPFVKAIRVYEIV